MHSTALNAIELTENWSQQSVVELSCVCVCGVFDLELTHRIYKLIFPYFRLKFPSFINITVLT